MTTTEMTGTVMTTTTTKMTKHTFPSQHPNRLKSQACVILIATCYVNLYCNLQILNVRVSMQPSVLFIYAVLVYLSYLLMHGFGTE